MKRAKLKCAFDGCERKATKLACGRNLYGSSDGHPDPAMYCEEHAGVVADEHVPEYIVICPHCGCRFGIN